jgi:signal transduction histidine kinase
LSHELKTPVAILTGSLQILQKKLSTLSGIKVDSTLNRIERNLNRIVEIQDEVADIMEDKTYSAQKLLINMFDACQDELETLIEQNLDSQNLEESIKLMIDRKFGPRSILYSQLDFSNDFETLYNALRPQFDFRNIQIKYSLDSNLPVIKLPEEIVSKILVGLIKNAIENTPDNGLIQISIENPNQGILFKVHDFGVGIELDAQKRIFEGFFATQETLLYSTKTPYAFNAGGKGADLLRMKMFSDRLGFSLEMESKQCKFLSENKNYLCPGDIEKCDFCQGQKDCLNSGYTIFTIFFPSEKR